MSTLNTIHENQRSAPQAGVRAMEQAPTSGTGADLAQEFLALLNGLVGSSTPVNTPFLPPPAAISSAAAPREEVAHEEIRRTREDERSAPEEEVDEDTTSETELALAGSQQAASVATEEEVVVEEVPVHAASKEASEEGKRRVAALHRVVTEETNSEAALDAVSEQATAVAVKHSQGKKVQSETSEQQTQPQLVEASAAGAKGVAESKPVSEAGREPLRGQAIGQFDTVLPPESEGSAPQGVEKKTTVSASPAVAVNPAVVAAKAGGEANAQGGSPRVVIPSGDHLSKGSAPVSSITAPRPVAQPREFTLTQKLPAGLQGKIVEQIQKLLDSAKPNGNQMVVRLDPPELGSVTVRLSMRGEQMYARVVPENSEVETVLRERAQEIVQALSNSGVKAENINLTIGRESQEFSSLFYDQNRSAQHQSTGGDSQFEGQFSPRQGERDWRGSDDEGKERAEAPSGWVA